jgi:hypothetical protein
MNNLKIDIKSIFLYNKFIMNYIIIMKVTQYNFIIYYYILVIAMFLRWKNVDIKKKERKRKTVKDKRHKKRMTRGKHIWGCKCVLLF